MNKIIGRWFAAGLVFISLAGFTPGFVLAKESGIKSGKSGTGHAVAAKAVKAGFIKADPADFADEIVQLNKLHLISVASGTLTASSDVPPCLKQPGDDFVCMAMPTQLISIKLSSDTILLLRNRKRAALSDFASGDLVNVYGFRNDDQTIDALIVRDLDKPEVIKPISLSNQNVIDIQGNTLTVAQSYGYGDCKLRPCPMAATAKTPSAKMYGVKTTKGMLYPGIMFRKYEVHVSTTTSFGDAKGNSINFGDIKVGDLLNITGSIKNFDAPVEASSIRDTSIPRSAPGSLSIVGMKGPAALGVNVSGTWSIQVQHPGSDLTYGVNWGDTQDKILESAPAFADDNNSGTFSHAYAAPGQYTIQFSVQNSAGQTATASMTVQVSQ